MAYAGVIFTGSMVLSSADPTQLGRLSRNGVPTDWSSSTFPGVINPATSYHFQTLNLDIPALTAPFNDLRFIQIDVDSTSSTTFFSAYLNSYNPLNPAPTYLGDAGFSGNLVTGDPAFFQVIVPYGNHLVLLMNETTTNGGLNQIANITVEAFSDTGFSEGQTTPEPGTWVLMACGMALAGAGRLRRAVSRRRRVRGAGIGAAIVLLSLCGATLFAQDAIDPNVAAQIGALLQEKATRAPTQQKLNSQLWYALQVSRGQTIAGVGDVYARAVDAVRPNSSGFANVDISGIVSSGLLKQIASLGGTIGFASGGSVLANVPLTALESLASNADVSYIAPAAQARTNRILSPKMLMMPRRIAKFNSLGLPFYVGALTSQGDITHTANLVRSQLGKNGTGVKVGVLSDSLLPAILTTLIGTGDLPAGLTVVPGQAGPTNGSDEGAAMSEIVYDLAPGAQLFFATAFNGEASFAANIQTLRNTYGCDIIVDDVTYFDEGVFQDSTVAKAVNSVVASGALYFSSAGNSGNITSGTSGTWEGDFNTGPGSASPLPLGYTLHIFSGFQAFDVLTASTMFISTKWSDPLGASNND
jgi:hypothetical protein